MSYNLLLLEKSVIIQDLSNVAPTWPVDQGSKSDLLKKTRKKKEN